MNFIKIVSIVVMCCQMSFAMHDPSIKLTVDHQSRKFEIQYWYYHNSFGIKESSRRRQLELPLSVLNASQLRALEQQQSHKKQPPLSEIGQGLEKDENILDKLVATLKAHNNQQKNSAEFRQNENLKAMLRHISMNAAASLYVFWAIFNVDRPYLDHIKALGVTACFCYILLILASEGKTGIDMFLEWIDRCKEAGKEPKISNYSEYGC